MGLFGKKSTNLAHWFFLLIIVHITLGYPSQFDHEEEFIPKGKRKSYAGYKLLRTEPIAGNNLVTLQNLESSRGVHFWTYPLANRSLDIFISPNRLPKVLQVLNNLGLEHNVIFHDAEDIINQEQTPVAQELISQDDKSDPEYSSGENGFISNVTGTGIFAESRASVLEFFGRYQRYDAIMNFASQLARENPSTVSFQSIGTSFEGRDIGVLKISSGGSKPGIFIDGGMHAREWISPATVMYIMYKLVKDPNSKPLIDMFDWYIVPIVNVDGYEYTHTTDRYWRKTRSRSSNGCYGVDPNRNFGFHWAESGSSAKPCSDIYQGPRAFSEVETQALGRAMMHLKDKLKMYLTLHAYSQMWLVPWGYVKNQKPNDYNELMRMASFGKNALEKTYGTRYRLGTAPDLLYPAAGGSDDWAKGALGITYSYCLELRDQGRYGFALPPNQIRATGEETFNGVAAIAKELHNTLLRNEKKPISNADVQINSPSDEVIVQGGL